MLMLHFGLIVCSSYEPPASFCNDTSVVMLGLCCGPFLDECFILLVDTGKIAM